jgi:hypothetical protein
MISLMMGVAASIKRRSRDSIRRPLPYTCLFN